MKGVSISAVLSHTYGVLACSFSMLLFVSILALSFIFIIILGSGPGVLCRRLVSLGLGAARLCVFG